MADVHLPGVGGVSKKALMIGGISSAAVVGLFLLRKKSAAPAAAAGTAAAQDPNAIDPNTGLTYGEEAAGATSDYLSPGLQDTTGGPTYGSTGYTDPNTGQWVYGNSGTGQAAATTNTAWSQNAIAYLSQNGGVDPSALGAALGAYLNGQAVTTDQESLIDQAIAVEGYPPTAGTTGYPPGIRTSDTGTGAGGTGGSGGGVTGGAGAGTGTTGGGTSTTAKAAGAISNLRVTGYNKTGASFAWNPATGATKGYAWKLTGNGVSKSGTTTSTKVSVTGLAKAGVYNFAVQGLPGGPGNNIHTPSLKG